jgi:hypothetical protein
VAWVRQDSDAVQADTTGRTATPVRVELCNEAGVELAAASLWQVWSAPGLG